MPITIEDIAKEAGVSKATVSRVMNNTKAVSPELKEKVNQIIERNNFKPNIFARGLITKKAQTIGVIVPDISNPISGFLLKGINQICHSKGYTVMISESNGEKKEEGSLLKTLEDKNVDGVIIISNNSDISLSNEIKDIASFDDVIIPYVEEGVMVANLLFDEMNQETKTKNYYIEHKIVKRGSLTPCEKLISNKEMEVYLL